MPKLSASLRAWTCTRPTQDVQRSLERLRALPDVRHVAVLPDVHLSHQVCVGVALATDSLLYPAAVGGDIGCGMATVALQGDASLFASAGRATLVLEQLRRRIPWNRRPRGADLDGDLSPELLTHPGLRSRARRDGAVQLGTLGRGNHFVELQADEQERLWVLVHSGSRALGRAVAGHHAAEFRGAAASAARELTALEADSEEGRRYLADHDWARRYARANRRRILSEVERMLVELFGIAADWSTALDTDHNHLQREVQGGGTLWVHRKGAQAAGAGRPAVIPGSLADPTYHVVGRGCGEALDSCSHGAGRLLSRSEARRRVSPGQWRESTRDVWLPPGAAPWRREEAPTAYRNIRLVMRAQRDLVAIRRRLRPVLNYRG